MKGIGHANFVFPLSTIRTVAIITCDGTVLLYRAFEKCKNFRQEALFVFLELKGKLRLDLNDFDKVKERTVSIFFERKILYTFCAS